MPNFVRLWILVSTLLVSAGWILSALHQLNCLGYGLVFALAGLAAAVWRQKTKWRPASDFAPLRQKFLRRFRRPAPALFLLLAVLALLSGLLYPPQNYDANAYRLPRLLHWLWAEQWHWLHTADVRMNVSACGFEWLSAPLILFTHTDRFLFLINWVSYLMLPGLLFSVFTRLKVGRRVAWWWMWFLAAGWCFALQAGSIANDLFAAVYILAAVDLALRAREKNSRADLWLSLLAAALAVGAKQSNLPLLLLWFIAAWPARRQFTARPLGSVLVAGVAVLVSIVPISVLNYEHCGTWLPLEITGIGQLQLAPFWGVIGNLFYIPLQNILPPFLELLPPFCGDWIASWNELMRQFLLTPFGAHFTSFHNFGFSSQVYYPGISEGNVGLGLGVCLLVLASIHEMRRHQTGIRIQPVIPLAGNFRWLRLAPWALLLLFMAKVGSIESARLLTPYYAFLFLILLVHPRAEALPRNRSWKNLGLLLMAFTALIMATLGDRPLFPAQSILPSLRKMFPESKLIAAQCTRYLESPYQVIAARSDYWNKTLPPTAGVIGYYTQVCDVDDAGLSRPYGRRRVEYLLPNDPPARWRDLGIKYVVVNALTVQKNGGTMENWLLKYDGKIVGQYTFPRASNRAAARPDFYLVQLN